MTKPRYPKRLIEVDLPIHTVSKSARQEKEQRKGHIPQLHIYPAARPVTACRAVTCAALWLDPADEICPDAFRYAVYCALHKFSQRALSEKELIVLCYHNKYTWGLLATHTNSGLSLPDSLLLRNGLLAFIEDFSQVEATDHPCFVETAQQITVAAHQCVSGTANSRPLIFDPFAGGGAIPLEALRVGCDTFASDLGPLAVILNKLVAETIPNYGEDIATHVEGWLAWAKGEAHKELGSYYPCRDNGEVSTAYISARTIDCEGPSCGAQVPLLTTLLLGRKGNNAALRILPNPKLNRVEFEVIEKPKPSDVGVGTVKRGSATCPLCGYTTPVTSVRKQLAQRRGGAVDSRLVCVVTMKPGQRGRWFRLPTDSDQDAVLRAASALFELEQANGDQLSLVPNEPFPQGDSRAFTPGLYGVKTWGDLFTPRQALALVTYTKLARQYISSLSDVDTGVKTGVALALAMVIDRLADLNTSLCVWQLNTPNNAHVFGRWAIPIVFDFAEVNPLAAAGGSPESAVRRIVGTLKDLNVSRQGIGIVVQSDAEYVPLPDDSAAALITDPPYYDAIPYAGLLDFFTVWLRRVLDGVVTLKLVNGLSPKDEECIVNPAVGKNKVFFEEKMKRSLSKAREIVAPWGIAIVVFAHKSTQGWEAQLEALLNAGWIVTASWPIDTEMGSRLRAKGSAALASSIHLVCRPREGRDGSIVDAALGDWRQVLQELPQRIHDWMPRLAEEGVVGADAIFACLGPALEIFSRYSRVEKTSGEVVTLKEYLEQVWAAVAREALSLVFAGAETSSFEPDARLTAIWLWTLNAGVTADATLLEEADSIPDDDEEAPDKGKLKGGFTLEYDAARKIAQGLGAHLEELSHLVEIKGDQARLLPVAERTKHLFGKEEAQTPFRGRSKKKPAQGDLFADLKEAEEDSGWGAGGAPKAGETVLDRIHQGMILFAAGRGEALKRFLVEEGAGRDPRYWSLAQALSALYPTGTDEKRWVDGVLARKKSLGF